MAPKKLDLSEVKKIAKGNGDILYSSETQDAKKKILTEDAKISQIGMTYYNDLIKEFKILDYVKYYQDDFKKYDLELFKAMPEKDNEFLLSIRETGSNLLCFYELLQYFSEISENKTLREKNTKEWSEEIKTFHFTNNTKFYHGKEGKIKEITKDQAIALFEIELSYSKGIPLIKEPSKLFKVTKRYLGIKANEAFARYSSYLHYSKREESDDELREIIVKEYLKAKYKKDLQSLYTLDEQMALQKVQPEELKLSVKSAIESIKNEWNKYFKDGRLDDNSLRIEAEKEMLYTANQIEAEIRRSTLRMNEFKELLKENRKEQDVKEFLKFITDYQKILNSINQKNQEIIDSY